jgi:hypothetical protein
MTARLVAGVVLVMVVGLAGGCQAKEGQKVVGYEGGKVNNWKKAPETGQYTLRTPGGSRNVTYYVRKDERVGFRKGGVESAVEAYAGDNAPVYLDRSAAKGAYWRFTEKSGQ